MIPEFALLAGALTSAGGSIWSQKSQNGSVNWGTVLRDGAVGAATGLIGGGASAAAAKATAGMTSCLGKNIVSGAVEGAIDGGASNGLQYLTSGQPITPAGFARAVGEGAGEGAIGGGAGGALSKVTGVSRYGCFTADTPVVMADGSTKPISQVEAGERVLAHDPATGEDVPASVEQTFTHERVPTLRVTTTGGVVETTATHPFYVEGRGYTPASELHEGDTLHTPDGQVTQVVSVQATGRAETVHNLTIAGLHNYHVVTDTGQAILVHNQTVNGCGPEEWAANRAAELQSQVPEASRGRVTMGAGVVETVEGEQIHVIATSEPRGYLRKGVTANPDEVVATGDGHAETTIIDWSNEHGHRVVTIGVGGQYATPVLKRWKSWGNSSYPIEK